MYSAVKVGQCPEMAMAIDLMTRQLCKIILYYTIVVNLSSNNIYNVFGFYLENKLQECIFEMGLLCTYIYGKIEAVFKGSVTYSKCKQSKSSVSFYKSIKSNKNCNSLKDNF